MTELNYLNILLLLVPVIFLYRLLIYKIIDKLEKLYVSIIFWGLYFYGGIGASSYEVDALYSFYFLAFLSAFVLAYRFRYKFLHALKNEVKHSFKTGFFELGSTADIIIILYFFASLFSLIYPEFKLATLINPPAPDVLEVLRSSIDTQEQQVDVLTKIIFYLQTLMAPLYFISLYKYVKRPGRFFALMFLPLYINYCANSYLGRGMVLMGLLLWFFLVYMYNPKFRKQLIIGSLIGVPAMLVIFYVYTIARVGGDTNIDINGNIIEELFYTEINFPETFSDIVHSGQHIDFPGFLVWLFTLPIPKIFLGGALNVPIINFDLSEIVLGVSRYNNDFWVKLTGYISESYYIFGKYFFWVEALIVAWLSKFLFFMLRTIKGSEVLIIFIAIQFGFMFSRAGLGAIMPAFTNGFLGLYGFLFLKFYITKKQKLNTAV